MAKFLHHTGRKTLTAIISGSAMQVTPSGKVGFGVSAAKTKALIGKFPEIVVY